MRNALVFSLLCLLLAGCSAGASDQALTSAGLFYGHAHAHLHPRPSATPAPPTIARPLLPWKGPPKTQINVRARAGCQPASLGLLNFLSKLQIIGKGCQRKWWQIIYPDAPSGVGWVTAAYVEFKGDAIRSGGGRGHPHHPRRRHEMSREIPGRPPRAHLRRPYGRHHKQINVRAGPATANDSLGLLEANTTVTLTGRNEINTWVLIDFPAGPDGKGWVAALYLKDPNLERPALLR